MTNSGKLNQFRKAAYDGDPVAQVALGNIFENGEDVPIDKTEAASWYQRAAEQKYAPGQYALATLLSETDSETAHYWLEKSADQNFPPALYARATILLLSKKNDEIESAMKMLTHSAEEKFVPAMSQLAAIYTEGRPFIGKNINAAVKWAKKAAKFGGVEEKLLCAMLLIENGSISDKEESVAILQKLVKEGSVGAADFLSSVYQGGLYGVNKNNNLAIYYNKLARST